MNKTKLILLAAMAVLIALFFYFDLGQYLTLDALKANRDSMLQQYEAHQAAFLLGFIGIYIAVTALSLPGALILTLAGGAIFGGVTATLAINVGATTGATLAFLVARYLFREAVQSRFGDKLKGLNRGLTDNGTSYLLFLRLVPVFPFFLINLGAGLTGLPLRKYIVGTMIGILPGTFVYANAGANIARIDNIADIASPGMLGAFAMLGLFALVPTMIRKVKKGGPANGSGDQTAAVGLSEGIESPTAESPTVESHPVK